MAWSGLALVRSLVALVPHWAQSSVLERTPCVDTDGRSRSSLPWLVISASTTLALQLMLGPLRGNTHLWVQVLDAGTITKFATEGTKLEA